MLLQGQKIMEARMPEITFDEENHVYKHKNKIVPSVTQILNRVAVSDGESEHIPIGGNIFQNNDTAKRFGIAFHKYAELYLKGKEVEASEEMKPWIKQFHNFLLASGLETKDNDNKNVERVLYSSRYNYAGTADWIAIDRNGQVCVVDWKTSTAESSYWDLQLAAYANLVQEQETDKIRQGIKRISVRIDEDRYEKRTRKTEPDFNKFLSILNTYKIGLKKI